jgi:hypothetical protein
MVQIRVRDTVRKNEYGVERLSVDKLKWALLGVKRWVVRERSRARTGDAQVDRAQSEIAARQSRASRFTNHGPALRLYLGFTTTTSHLGTTNSPAVCIPDLSGRGWGPQR